MNETRMCSVRFCFNPAVWEVDGALYCNYCKPGGRPAKQLEVGPSEHKSATLDSGVVRGGVAAGMEPSEVKSFPVFIKSIGTEGKDEGIVEHLISVYGVPDYGRDIAHEGMFTKTLQERGSRIRVIDNHQKHSISSVIGKPLGFKEVGREELPSEVLQTFPEATGGMMAKTQFLLETPEGAGAFARIKSGAVNEFSYAYDALDFDFEVMEDKSKVRHLRTVRLFEYGPVIFAMNPGAVAVSAKDTVGGSEQKNPWNVFKQGDEYCVYKVNEEGDKVGKTLGCHASRSEASAQIRALHANEGKNQLEMMLEKSQNLVDFIRKVTTAFYNSVDSRASDSGSDSGSDSEEVNIADVTVEGVYGESLVISKGGNSRLYQVPFRVTEEGAFEFSESSNWVAGSYEFVPDDVAQEKETPPKTDALEVAKSDDPGTSGESGDLEDSGEPGGTEGSLSASEIELELLQIEMFLIEAGPAQ